jgi:cation-transporting ATPase E
VLRFSLPVGLITGAAASGGYAAARGLEPGSGVAGARTVATLVVLVVAFWTLGVLSRPLAAWKVALIGSMVAVVAVVLAVPALQEIVLLEPTPQALLLAAPLGATGALLVEITHRLTGEGERDGGRVLRRDTRDRRP